MTGISNGEVCKTEVVPQSQKPQVKANEQGSNDDKKTVQKRLVRKTGSNTALKKKMWLAGHLSVVVFGLLSLLFGVFRLENRYYIHSILYRLTLIGAFIALGATASHKFGLSNAPPISALLAHQNFQYFLLATLWLFTFKSIFKLIPYFLISLLQLAHTENILVISSQSTFLASLIAYDELFLIVYLLLRTIFFRNASGFQLLAFLTFYWLRILYNKETTNLFAALIDKVDSKITSIKNEKVQHYWSKTKLFVSEKQNQHI